MVHFWQSKINGTTAVETEVEISQYRSTVPSNHLAKIFWTLRMRQVFTKYQFLDDIGSLKTRRREKIFRPKWSANGMFTSKVASYLAAEIARCVTLALVPHICMSVTLETSSGTASRVFLGDVLLNG